MKKILRFIDIFPVVHTSNVTYEGEKEVKSSAGGCGTILYVLILLGLLIYYAVPVFEQQTPKIGAV